MALKSPNLNVMVKAAERAAKSLLRDFGEVEQLQVSKKGPADFVSAADKRAEEIIFFELKKARPDYSFLMEESGEVKGADPDHRWIIDPLDGTANFLHGIPHWAISIALESRGELVAGLIYDPVKDEMVHAEKNGGAFSRRKRLRVSGRDNAAHAIIGMGGLHGALKNPDQFFKEQHAAWRYSMALRRGGSAALDICGGR